MTTSSKPQFRAQAIDHVELFVSDLYQAARWYRDALGLEIVKDFEHWAADGTGPLMISSDAGATKLALFRGPVQREGQPQGIRRIAFRTGGDGFLAFLERLDSIDLRNRQGQRVTPSDVVDHEEAFSIYFCDADGTLLELTTYDVKKVRGARHPGVSV